MKGYDQRVSQPDNWLHNGAEENRQFVKVVHLPEGQSWAECTNEKKEQWEHDHQPEDQVDPEPETDQPEE